MEDWLGIAGKVVIVTGGSSGIGAAVVHSLLEQGTCVVNADLNPSQDEHENLMFVKTDVTSLADVKNVVTQTKGRFGREETGLRTIEYETA